VGKDMISVEQLARDIVAKRKLIGMNQEVLASLTGISAKFLSQLENGKKTAETEAIAKVLIALGINAKLLTNPSTRATTIKNARTSTGLNLADTAGLVGISANYLSAVENGKSNLRIGDLIKIINGLGIDSLNGSMAEENHEQI
jgi:transcriptional regulator with XRE-family HTH domain